MKTYYHGTRDKLAYLIARDGLKSSSKSHQVTGLWMTEDCEWALNWGVTPFDTFPGCAFIVQADKAELRQNNDIGAKKAVASAKSGGQVVPNIILESIVFRIPSKPWDDHRQKLVEAIKEAISNHYTLVYNKQNGVRQRQTEILDVCTHRYSCFNLAMCAQYSFGRRQPNQQPISPC